MSSESEHDERYDRFLSFQEISVYDECLHSSPDELDKYFDDNWVDEDDDFWEETLYTKSLYKEINNKPDTPISDQEEKMELEEEEKMELEEEEKIELEDEEKMELEEEEKMELDKEDKLDQEYKGISITDIENIFDIQLKLFNDSRPSKIKNLKKKVIKILS